MCAGSVADTVQAVVNGADGCLFCYGHAHLGEYIPPLYPPGGSPRQPLSP